MMEAVQFQGGVSFVAQAVGLAQEAILRRYSPRPHEADLRNWEWRYLAHVSEGDPHVSLVAHSASVSSLRFLGDDTLLTRGLVGG